MFIPPLFSIITVTYNAANTIEATLKSVAAQSFTNFEFIVIDGASSDNTLEQVKQSGIANVIISEPDRGIYDAMNKGLSKSKGQYLIFLNAGDSFHSPHTLQQIATLIGDKRPGVIYGETAIVDHNRNFLRMRRLQAPENLSWKSFANGMLVCHQAFIARKEIAPSYYDFINYRFSADVDWCIRCMKQTNDLFNTHLTLIDYLNEGVTTRNRYKSLIERYRIMCKHYGYFSTFIRHIGFALRFAIAKIRGIE